MKRLREMIAAFFRSLSAATYAEHAQGMGGRKEAVRIVEGKDATENNKELDIQKG